MEEHGACAGARSWRVDEAIYRLSRIRLAWRDRGFEGRKTDLRLPVVRLGDDMTRRPGRDVEIGGECRGTQVSKRWVLLACMAGTGRQTSDASAGAFTRGVGFGEQSQ